MGRPAGAANKNKRGLKARLKQEFDLDVIESMAEQCVKLINATPDVVADKEDQQKVESAIDNLNKLAQYCEPKLKAVEVTGEMDTSLTIEVIKDFTGGS